jgi:3-dehydroquinate synthase
VDSSVGGKTAIDLPGGKNLVGSFHQPRGVLVDPALLDTLPARQRRAGLAEIVKVGMATDARLFRWLERQSVLLAAGDSTALELAVRKAIRAKARVVTRDEREREGGARTALNFGHTLDTRSRRRSASAAPCMASGGDRQRGGADFRRDGRCAP